MKKLVILFFYVTCAFANGESEKCDKKLDILPMSKDKVDTLDKIVKKVNPKPARQKIRFKSGIIYNLTTVTAFCMSMITGHGPELMERNIAKLVKEGGITKEHFIKEEIFNINCDGADPIGYALTNRKRNVEKLMELGVDFNRKIKDQLGRTATFKDYVIHKLKTAPANERSKWFAWAKMIKKTGKYKSCREQGLECTAPYLY
jgi:hypothetical protein